MKHTKFFLIITIILLFVIAIWVVFPRLELRKIFDIVPIDLDKQITFTEEQSIHFYEKGFAIIESSSLPSRFYNWDGDEIEHPISQEVLPSTNINIVHHTNNHIVTGDGKIFNTSTIPFKLIYDNPDLNIWDIKEYTDFLLILSKEEDNKIEPKILVNNSDFLISLEGMENTRYLSAACEKGSKNISFLNISLDTAVPVTRIFHYTNRNEIYGVLSLNDEFIYNIYRIKSNIILIGTESILCYNVDGEYQWNIEKELEASYQVLETDDGLLMYFPDFSTIDGHEGNVILINDENEYSFASFPKYLSNLQVYKDDFIALDYRNILFYMNSKGKILKEVGLNQKVDFIASTPFQSDKLFVRTGDNVLTIYTTNTQDNGKDENK